MDVFKDNVGYGEELNEYFGSIVDFKDCYCYKVGGVIWAIHSYREREGEMYNSFQAEISVLHQHGQFTRNMIRAALQGFFDSHDRNERLTAIVSPFNKRGIRLAKISGFVEEGRIRRSNKKDERLIFSMLKEEYKKKWKKQARHVLEKTLN
ncbi:MAG: GNAT family protein [Candidatus Bathyarchaeia archaeon]